MRRSPIAIAIIAAVLGCGRFAEASAGPPDPPIVVTLKAPDGAALKATYFPAGRPGPGILLLHQCNAERSTWAPMAKAASARGFHVLTLDFRGFGESGGERPDRQAVVDERWPGDVDAAFAWLKAQPGVDGARIGAAGASCGVNQSVQLARRHPEVKTVVLLSGPVNPQGREYLRSNAWLPVFAAASRDDGDAVASMKWVLGWSRNPANRFVEYQAAGHGTEMFAVEKGLEPAVLDWFETHLRKAPATPPPASAAVKPTLVEKFWSALAEPGGAARAREMYDAARGRKEKVVLFPEGEMNLQGYQLLQEGRTTDAIVVFQMNVDEYPRSANVYDSLSDAQLAAGNKADALRNAEKALEVLASDTRVPDQLRAAIKESAEKKIRDLKK